MNTFLLIDNAILTVSGADAIAADARPDWLACLYEDKAACVSPHLIDIDAVHEAGELDRMMALVNATLAKWHVSIIDTVLTLPELAHHLRRFIMIRCAGRKNLTLRFADGVVLPQLARAFTPAQWAALVAPMARWQVHGYDGQLLALPGADAAAPVAATPLVLTEDQLTALDAALLPNKVLASLRARWHGAALPGTVGDQHRWASDACRLWRNAGNANDIVLTWLTSAAMDTNGAVLEQGKLGALLSNADLAVIRAGLHAEVAQHRAKLNRSEKFHEKSRS